MSTIYDWPAAWDVLRFQMRIVPNVRSSQSPYSGAQQVLDLLGERWYASFDLPPEVDFNIGQAKEAFFDRLLGQVNLVRLWPMHRPQPRGTIGAGAASVSVVNASLAAVSVVNASAAAVTVQGGNAMLDAPIAQLSNQAPLIGRPGRTVYAGDHCNLANGQLVRAMNDVVLDASGNGTMEFLPRARTAIAAGTSLNFNKPTAVFMLKTADGVPIDFRRARVEGISLEWSEVPQQ